MSRLPACLALAAVAWAGPVAAQARDPGGVFVSVTPSGGIGPVFDHGAFVSFNGTVHLELDVTRGPWRWSAFASARGIGARCDDGCDLGGTAVGAGLTIVEGRVGLGGGLGALRQSDGWHALPHLSVVAESGPLRVQARLDWPRGGYGVFLPVLVGVPLPSGGAGSGGR